jgi:hypothetical protein
VRVRPVSHPMIRAAVSQVPAPGLCWAGRTTVAFRSILPRAPHCAKKNIGCGHGFVPLSATPARAACPGEGLAPVSRAQALSVPVRNGAFRLRGRDAGHVHAGQQERFDELTTFPFGAPDDLLDAATGPAYLLDRPEPRVG